MNPEEIAHTLFSSEPKPACSCQITTEQNTTDLTFIFEILIIILLEGLEIIIGDLSEVNLQDMTEEHITTLNPWFESIGFKIKVILFPKESIDQYLQYYCRIIIKDKLHKIYFDMKNIKTNYHFYLNGPFLQQNKSKNLLNQLYAIYHNGNSTFKIWFEPHYPLTNNIVL